MRGAKIVLMLSQLDFDDGVYGRRSSLINIFRRYPHIDTQHILYVTRRQAKALFISITTKKDFFYVELWSLFFIRKSN